MRIEELTRPPAHACQISASMGNPRSARDAVICIRMAFEQGIVQRSPLACVMSAFVDKYQYIHG
jgi:hypothetical protein